MRGSVEVKPVAAEVRSLGRGPEPESVFRALSASHAAFFLDSAGGGETCPRDARPAGAPDERARWSFLGAEPFLVMEATARRVTLRRRRGSGWSFETITANPFAALREALGRHALSRCEAPTPFAAGAVGFLGYDLKNHVERLPSTAVRDQSFPDLRMAFYDRSLAFDSGTASWYASAAPASVGEPVPAGEKLDSLRRILDRAGSLEAPSANGGLLTGGSDASAACGLTSNMTRDEYLRAVERIIDYIAAGDIYQANFTQRFEGRTRCAPDDIYLMLRKRNPAPFAAYLDCGGLPGEASRRAVLSSSPERFLELRGREIETRPIKGTRPRGRTPEEDEANADDLLGSAKDAAELAMIVDLERNDLGRVADYGAVRVAEPRTLEAYPTVFHLVATVTGRLAEGKDGADLLKATFPGGSITGAPKVRAMEIIDELEPTARSVYTGAVGYVDFSGDLDLNIVIRTILYDGGRVTYQVGGGIVADSDPEAEYEECLAKGRALAEVLGRAGTGR